MTRKELIAAFKELGWSIDRWGHPTKQGQYDDLLYRVKLSERKMGWCAALEVRVVSGSGRYSWKIVVLYPLSQWDADKVRDAHNRTRTFTTDVDALAATAKPFQLSIKPQGDHPRFIDGFSLGTDEKIAREEAEVRFRGRNEWSSEYWLRHGKEAFDHKGRPFATESVALIVDGKTHAIYDFQGWNRPMKNSGR